MNFDFYITPEDYNEAAKNGVNSQLLEARIRSLAWNKERALKTPPRKKKPIKDWVEVARKNGICYSTLRYRANRLGWSLEKAATQPLQNRKEQAKIAYEKSRVYPKEYVEMSTKNGIHYDTFRRRVKSGWDIKVAATKPTMTSREIGLLIKEKTSKSK